MQKAEGKLLPSAFILLTSVSWTGGRVVERGGLENRYARECIGGSNPSLSGDGKSEVGMQKFLLLTSDFKLLTWFWTGVRVV